MSEDKRTQRRDKRKNRLIVVLVVLVVLLLGVVIWLMLRAGIGRGALQRLGQGFVQLPGLRILLGQLNADGAEMTARGRQLLAEGAALEQEGKTHEALRLYQQAQEAMPNQAAPHLALASAHETLGEWEEALAHLETAVELAPENARVQRALGRMQCMNDQYEACIQTLQTALDLEPDNAEGHYLLGLAYRQGADGRSAEAERAYLRALQLEPDLAEVHLALGNLYQSQPGMEAQARERIDQALRLAIENGDAEVETKAHAELARYYYGQSNYQLCVEEWQEVLQERPENEDALRFLGLCFAMRRDSGDAERAVAAFEQALELDFGQMDAYYFTLGQYYAGQEEYMRAFFAWDQFLRFSEDEELKASVRAWMEAYQEAMQEGQIP